LFSPKCYIKFDSKERKWNVKLSIILDEDMTVYEGKGLNPISRMKVGCSVAIIFLKAFVGGWVSEIPGNREWLKL
jgi:hypothetical protein